MRTMLPLALFPLLSVAVAQQQPATPPTRSLAAGLVRQQVEIERAKPPVVEQGREVGAGQGPMVLLLRRADGTLHLHELQRGDGDHGPAAEPRRLDVEPETPAHAPVAEEPGAPVRILLRRVDGGVAVGIGDDPAAIAGKQVDRAAVAKLLAQQRALAPKVQDVLIDAAPAVTMQQLLTVRELVQAAGFRGVLFDGAAAREPASAADRELLAGLPASFGWHVERTGPQPVCSGELLLLVDGDVPWGEIAPLYLQCARVGIWEIAFACKRDDKTFLKLPVHLPFDRGM